MQLWCFIPILGFSLIQSGLQKITAKADNGSMISPAGTGNTNGTTPYTSGSTTPLDIERYPVAPNGLELEQVYLFVRHGGSWLR
jgi:hypothetical protein